MAFIFLLKFISEGVIGGRGISVEELMLSGLLMIVFSEDFQKTFRIEFEFYSSITIMAYLYEKQKRSLTL